MLNYRTFLKRIQFLDAFPKVETNIQVNTESGGVTTVAVLVVLFYLLVGEYLQYITPVRNFKYFVDPVPHVLTSDPFGFERKDSYNKELQINVDISVAMPCKFLRVDVLDLTNTRLKVSDEIKKDSVVFKTLQDVKKLGTSGSWGGYKDDIHALVTDAHKQSWKEWWNDGTTPDNVKFDFEKARKNNDPLPGTEGCRIHGAAFVQRISGMLHITSLGHGYGGAHTPHEMINFTHRIDHFSFGKRYPGLRNPLDKTFELDENLSTMFQYFIAIVPTTYRDSTRMFFSKKIDANQYAVTDSSKALEHDAGVPGLFMKYDIEPINVEITQTKVSFLHFIVRVCGIIGGLFATAGMFLEASRNFTRFMRHMVHGAPVQSDIHVGSPQVSGPSDMDPLLQNAEIQGRYSATSAPDSQLGISSSFISDVKNAQAYQQQQHQQLMPTVYSQQSSQASMVGEVPPPYPEQNHHQQHQQQQQYLQGRDSSTSLASPVFYSTTNSPMTGNIPNHLNNE